MEEYLRLLLCINVMKWAKIFTILELLIIILDFEYL